MEALLLLPIMVAGILLFKSKRRRKLTVKKGNSYSFVIPTLHLGVKELNGEVRLTKESQYKRDNLQINKLTGIAWGHHHWHSIRIGEMCNPDGTFTIYAYGYYKGDRFYEPLTVVNPTNGVTLKYKMGNKKGRMYLSVYNSSNEPLGYWSMYMPITILPGYYNGFYHEDAPEDVSIYNEWY